MNPKSTLANIVCILTLLLLSYNFLNAQQKAFPSAVGGGAYASGGRGGNVYHVTNLLDDSSEGSLRWALAQPRPATIVFDVSGVISTTSKLWFTGNDLTIAGQTAPEGGITITPSGSNINPQVGNSENIIMRYLRFRMQFYGDSGLKVFPGYDSDDQASNLILDHISINWSGLQGFTLRGHETHSITFQNGLIAESKTGSLFGDTDPDHAGFSYNNTFAKTLFYNISHRTPNSSSGRADIYNNVIYDWKNRWTVVKTNALVNHINNYIFTGNKNTLYYQYQNDDPIWHINGVTNENPNFPPSIYSAGNIIQDLWEDPDADNYDLWIEHAYSGQTEQVDPDLFRNTPHPMIGYVPNILTAIEASQTVPEDAGAYKFLNADGSVGVFRDSYDTRYVYNTINDSPEAWDCCGSGPNNNRHSSMDQQPYLDFIASISSTPINTRPSNFYNPDKSEHIPEIWFDANVPEGQDHNDLAPSGYTWLEEYLNQVDSVEDIGLDSVTVSPDSAAIEVGASEQLNVSFNPVNATNQIGTWTSSDTSIATVDSNGLVTGVAASDTPVVITFTSNDGPHTDTSQITVFEEALQASAGEDQSICEGEITTLTATGGSNYLWSTGETTQSITVSPLSTTEYTVTVTSGNVSDDDSVTVFVDPNPNVTIVNGNNVDILTGDFITLTATGANTYEWNNGATQPNIAVSPSQTTTYEVRGYINDCYDEKQVTVNVYQEVQASAGEDVTICLDDSVILSANGGDEYLWSTGETTQSIEVSPEITTDYFVTVFNPMDFDEAAVRVEVDTECDLQPTEPQDETLGFGMDFYPNPADRFVDINVHGTYETSKVEIYDITGKLVISREIENDNAYSSVSKRINISKLQEGIYVLRLLDENRDIAKKLIIN